MNNNTYLTYERYVELGGDLDEPVFNKYVTMAQAVIDRHTFGRIKAMTTIPYSVQLCCFELINVCRAKETGVSGIASENVGDWSRSYTAKTAAENEQTETDLLLTYLSGVDDDNGVPLLYRGVVG